MRVILSFLLLVVTSTAVAEDHTAALNGHLTDDVLAVAYVDLAQLDVLGLLEFAEQLDVIHAEERKLQTPAFLAVQSRLDAIVEAGARYVYVLFRASDVARRGPTWVVPVAKEESPQEVLESILGVRSGQPGVESNRLPSPFPQDWKVEEGAVVGWMGLARSEEAEVPREAASVDLTEAWETLGDGTCGLIVFGDDNTRRVVREMFPELPPPFAAVDGKLIADGLKWGGISLSIPPELGAEIVVETRNNETVSTVEQAVTAGLNVLESSNFAGELIADDSLDGLVDLLSVRVDGTKVTLKFKDLEKDFERITRLLSPPIRSELLAAQRRRRMNLFKQISLAMLNYESARGTYPPRASFDEAGKPLLSWRVHILPYMEQGHLYQQFHLDEPWDSKHNRQLIEKMPEVYADPDSALRRLNAEGNTTYVVPVGTGTLFNKQVGIPIGDVKDGTSNTILLVEVVPERAVEWTRPYDWFVDSEDPLDGVERSDRDQFTVAYCDGHVTFDALEDWVLRALLTYEGGEVVE